VQLCGILTVQIITLRESALQESGNYPSHHGQDLFILKLLAGESMLTKRELATVFGVTLLLAG
jgi:hypothetical protein